MDYDRYRLLRMTPRGKILTVALNRPEALNAINERLHYELSTIFYDVALDDAAEVIVLTGEGSAFSSGGDIKWMAETRDPSATEAKKVINGLLDLEKPIIARINGPAVGLGATLALFCDLAYATHDAPIGDPHVRVGLVAGDGGAVIWPQLIGFMRAKRYLLTGDTVSGREAAAIGLINGSVEPEMLDASVFGMAERLAQGATRAIRWTKAAVNQQLKALTATVLEASVAYEIHSFKTDDHREAVNAFIEKRKPRFVGR